MRTYSGFTSLQTISPFSYTLDAAGNANSSIVVGSFDYSTDETILQQIGAYAFDGILEIFGDNRSTARIAIIDSTNLNVQVDANGSTNYEVSIVMTWNEFLGVTGGPQSSKINLNCRLLPIPFPSIQIRGLRRGSQSKQRQLKMAKIRRKITSSLPR